MLGELCPTGPTLERGPLESSEVVDVSAGRMSGVLISLELAPELPRKTNKIFLENLIVKKGSFIFPIPRAIIFLHISIM